MLLRFINIPVTDQDRALQFYTEKIGFKKAADIDMGTHRFLTVYCPEHPEGVHGPQLVFEPLNFPQAKELQKAKFDAGKPAISLMTKNIKADYERLKHLGIKFCGKPEDISVIISVLFEDTCGNLVYLVESKG